MKLSRYFAAGAAVFAAGTIAWGAGLFSTLPIVGNPSFCASNVSGVGSTVSPYVMVPANTQGTSSGICGQTVPAGPPALTGNELIPADTGLTGSAPPQTVTIPSGMLSTYGSNVLVGGDFGQNLWQRGTTPVNALTTGSAAYTADGWFVYSVGTQTTVTKQTGATDIFAGTTASARISRPNAQTGVLPIVFGQLVPDDSSQRFQGTTAIFSCYLQSGALFSPAGGNVSMIIAYHTAADTSSEATNGQGTNTATFASSSGATQNITGYVEAVNTAQPVTTAWARYSVAAVIPVAAQGVGVKLFWTPVGTAGATDWLEAANCQLESRAGNSVGPSGFNRRLLVDEYNLEFSRYWTISSAASGTPIFGSGMVSGTNNEVFYIPLPVVMRITPVTSPIVSTGFVVDVSGTLTALGAITAQTNTQRAASLGASATATTGQAVLLTTNAAGGTVGFSAEP